MRDVAQTDAVAVGVTYNALCFCFQLCYLWIYREINVHVDVHAVGHGWLCCVGKRLAVAHVRERDLMMHDPLSCLEEKVMWWLLYISRFEESK